MDVTCRAIDFELHQIGATATALSTCYAGMARRSGLLLGFGGSTERRLLDATRVLGEVLRELIGTRLSS
ncbi:MAG: hypothetical protein ACR2HK_04785 [Gemmatimonadales bacterium]